MEKLNTRLLQTIAALVALGFSSAALGNDGFRMHSKGVAVEPPAPVYTGYFYGYGGISFGGGAGTTGSFNDLTSPGAQIVAASGLNPSSIPINFDLRDGYNAGVGLGLYSGWLNGSRFEVEGSWEAKDVGSLNYGGFLLASDFEFKTAAIMFNFLKEIPVGAATAYTGFGIGYAETEMNGDVGGVLYNRTDSGFAWQFILGLDVPISERWALFTQYRYRVLEDLTFASNFGDFSFTTNDKPAGHAVSFGARVSF